MPNLQKKQAVTNKSAGIVFTDAAAQKVKKLIEEEQNPKLKLRVFVQGGGCSGLQYGFTFDESENEGDTVIENTLADEDDGSRGSAPAIVKLLVDPMSYPYLKNAEIDYREDVAGAQFVIRNPDAKTTCGCGSSFDA